MDQEAMEKGRRGRGSFAAVGSSATLFLLLFLMQHAAAQQEHPVSSIERSALLELRSSLGLQARDWPVEGHPCSNWTGIRCENGRIIGINISGFKRTHHGRRSPQFAVDALANLTYLSSFNASGFLLPGPIPSWLGSTVGSLQTLDLRSCSVNGSIPGSLGNLSRLKFLYLSDNNLTGNIDSNLGQLSELSVLSLSGNLLTGPIPEELSMLGNLTRLDLSSNFIVGTIPPSLGFISRLQVLNLSDNCLTASVPAELSNLSQLSALDLSKNSISGSLPVELKALMSLQDMKVGNNGLDGGFPENLFSGLVQLKYLDVSGNSFTGEFPRISSWGSANLTNVVFNFSNNLFYGTLNLSSLDFLGSLDLSGNYFQGNVTNSVGINKVNLDNNCLQNILKRRSLLDCRQFYSQQNLSFYEFGDTEAPVPRGPVSRKRRWVYILIGIGSGLGFILLLLLILVCLLRRFRRRDSGQRGKNADVGPAPEVESPAIPKEPLILSATRDSFSYNQMVQATCNFDKSNLIKNGHSGDLYLGLLDGRAPVVIKRITSLGPGPYLSEREPYAVELEFFRRASNTRLVPLLGYCLEKETEKFLVYRYMPNGDLASSFYRATESEGKSFRSLDWITRLKIAIGAAEGLSYLHHECSPPFVHRDVRASSILLDDKFEVRLGSLSEVHLQEGDPHHNAIMRLLRKPQTSEPGPAGPWTATCAYDVFCFGKVLLELVSGKIGISQSDDATSREWLEQTLQYIRGYDRELVMKIIDPSLIVDEDLLDEVLAMAIVARSCLNPKPSKRPPMKYILRALENPLRVVRRQNNFGSFLRPRRNSSTGSWSATFSGSRLNSSSGSAPTSGHSTGGLKQSGGVTSHSSGGGNDFSSGGNKRLPSEIFPEPVATDVEAVDGGIERNNGVGNSSEPEALTLGGNNPTEYKIRGL